MIGDNGIEPSVGPDTEYDVEGLKPAPVSRKVASYRYVESTIDRTERREENVWNL